MKKKSSAAKKRKASFTPAGYPSVTPYLACGDAAAAIEFYKRAFGATEVMRMPGPGGKIGHAHVYVKDVDATMQRALADPFGHVWHLATHKEDVSVAELKKRAEKLVKEMGG